MLAGQKSSRDPLLDWMRASGIELTVENYLFHGWPDGIADEDRAEIMGSLPRELRERPFDYEAWKAEYYAAYRLEAKMQVMVKLEPPPAWDRWPSSRDD
jgi:hypothetical protein